MNVSLKNVGKHYTSDWIFRGLSAELSSNNIYGIVGHNGSGKSTLLQIISGYVTPNEGELIYEGGSLEIENVYQFCSISAPYIQLPAELKVKESIANQSQFKAFSIDQNDLLSELELTGHKDKLIGQLSSGMLQRLKLGLAIFTESTLLLLDEPCANLDEKWCNWYNSTLSKMAIKRTIVISSNSNKQELALCNQPMIDISVHH